MRASTLPYAAASVVPGALSLLAGLPVGVVSLVSAVPWVRTCWMLSVGRTVRSTSVAAWVGGVEAWCSRPAVRARSRVGGELCRNKPLQIPGASPAGALLARSRCKAPPFELASGPRVLTREEQTTTSVLSSSVNSFQLLHVPIWLCLGKWK